MKKKTYKLQIRQASTYQYQVIVPEIGAKKTAATLDRALNITLHDILNHLTTCPLIRVFADQDVDTDSLGDDPQECPPTALEYQTALEVTQQSIAPQSKRRELHLVLEVARPLTQAQATCLNEQAGKLFDRYYFNDMREVKLDTLFLEAHE